jgi:hypothetical protein
LFPEACKGTCQKGRRETCKISSGSTDLCHKARLLTVGRRYISPAKGECEALERRHQIGRGSLVVLDWIPESGSATYEERREFLAGLVETERMSTGEWQSFPENALFLPPSVRDEGNAVPEFYARLKVINRRLRCDCFEGVVMKRGNAPYPMQLRSDTEDCRVMIKHRFVN